MASSDSNETADGLTRVARWRGVPVTELTLLLAGPLLMGTVLAMALFRLNLQAVRMGYPPRVQAWLPTVFAVAYVLCALAAGRWVSRRHTTVMMIVTVTLAAAGALSVSATAALGQMLVLAVVVGALAGAYFVSFQVNLQNVQPFHTLAWSIACFNISWGLGEAAGPALASAAGWWPMRTLGAVLAALTLVHVAVIVAAARAPRPERTGAPRAEPASTPRLRIVGWGSMFLGTMVYVALIATLYPGLGHARGWSDERIAMGVVLLALPMAAVSPVWAKLRGRLGSPMLLLAALALFGIALGVLPWLETWAAVSAALVVAGAALGSIAFHAVYYANADALTPGRSVGINEAMAGLGAMLGPAAIGALAWDDFTAVRAYVGPGAVLVGAAIVLALWWAVGRTSRDPRGVDSESR